MIAALLERVVKPKEKAPPWKFPASPIWTTRSGVETPLRELDDDHLENIAKLLVRHAVSKKLRRQASMMLGPYPNGDAAQMAFDQEEEWLAHESWRTFAPPQFPFVEAELKRRWLHIEEGSGEWLERYGEAHDHDVMAVVLTAALRKQKKEYP